MTFSQSGKNQLIYIIFIEVIVILIYHLPGLKCNNDYFYHLLVARVFSCSENRSNAPNSEQMAKVLRICSEFAFSSETLRVLPC